MDETLVWYSGAGIASTDRHWLHTDEQGSVIASSDDTGAGTIYVYSPTGEPQGGFSAGGAIFRYTGQAQLAALGLYYYKARIYDPQMGRFLQADPAGYSAGMNLYAYVMNNYPNASDPSGLDEFCPDNSLRADCTVSGNGWTPGLRDNPCVFNSCLTICDRGTSFCTPASIPDQGFVRDRPAPPDQKPRPQGTNRTPQKGNVCPSPGAMAAYKFGGGLGQFGGKAVTYGAALQVATAPGYLTPFTAPAAAAGTAAGALSETIGGEAAFGGTTIQVVAGTVIYLQTGDWVPLYASGAPALASALSPLNGLFGPSLEDRLQSYLESRSPTLRNCGG